MERKGISPLIATVLLIAFTMAIAGIMATWATSFVNVKMSEADNASAATCTGIINVDARIYRGSGFAIVDVGSSTTGLTNWKGYLYYDDPSMNRDANISNTDISLKTGDTWTFNFTAPNFTNASSAPKSLKLSSGNCPAASRTSTITIMS